jgi:hypothetical protein
MAGIVFPFWMVSSRQADITLPVVPVDAAGFVATFSTVEMATAFMVRRGETNWQLKTL